MTGADGRPVTERTALVAAAREHAEIDAGPIAARRVGAHPRGPVKSVNVSRVSCDAIRCAAGVWAPQSGRLGDDRHSLLCSKTG